MTLEPDRFYDLGVTISAHDSLVLLALLVAGTALLVLAPIVRIPYPILLVLGGLGIGFIPGVPHLALRPDIVLVGFLPPLLYSGAFFTSLRDLRTNARPISLLSVGLVLATMLDGRRGLPRRRSDGLSWPVCFVIGAIVAPTDAVAATAIGSRLGLPRRLVTLIEGESLINDATALVAYRFAVAAVVTGSFSLWHATWRFGVDVVGGIGDRPRGRLPAAPVPAPHQPLADRDRDRAALGLLRLPAGAGGRRLGGARRRHRRRLRRLVHARADDRADAAAGRRGLGDPDVPAQRAAVRPRRPAAAPDPRLAARAARPASLLADGAIVSRGGDRDAPRLDLPGDLHPALGCRSASASAIPTRRGSTRR